MGDLQKRPSHSDWSRCVENAHMNSKVAEGVVPVAGPSRKSVVEVEPDQLM